MQCKWGKTTKWSKFMRLYVGPQSISMASSTNNPHIMYWNCWTSLCGARGNFYNSPLNNSAFSYKVSFNKNLVSSHHSRLRSQFTNSMDGLIKVNSTCHLAACSRSTTYSATFAFSGISSDLPTFVIHFSCLYIAKGGGPASRKEKYREV